MQRGQLSNVNQVPQGLINFNQSSVANNEAFSYSKIDHLGGEMSQSDSSLWLNDDMINANMDYHY